MLQIRFNDVDAIKEQIKDFHKRQKYFYGYIKYKVRTKKEKLGYKIVSWHYVDAYMKCNDLIKTCKTNLNDNDLLKFMEQIKGEMKHD
jgi:hypothetical protein